MKAVTPARVHDARGRRWCRRQPGLRWRGVGLGPVALLGHEAAEAVLVDLDALLGGHLEGEVDREAVGVVQRERLLAGERACRPAFCRSATAVSKIVVPVRRVCANSASSAAAMLARRPASSTSSGYCGPIASTDASMSSPMTGSLGAEQAHVAHDAAQDAAQHVAAALVAGQDAVLR